MENLKNITELKEINFSDIDFVQIGSISDHINKTGITLLYFKNPAIVGCEISGGGPASRETPITLSETTLVPVNCIILSGGSAFGLTASGGVMNFLDEKNIGLKFANTNVPIVLQSCIFDLTYGNYKIRPDLKMGYDVCKNAFDNSYEYVQKNINDNIKKCEICKEKQKINKNFIICQNCLTENIKSGNYGGGVGATVCKACGMKYAKKCGIGFSAYEYEINKKIIKIGAVVIVNAYGDIYNRDGELILGLRNKENDNKQRFCIDEILKDEKNENNIRANTTIGCVIINANFSKGELNKLASMTRTAYGKCIRPSGMSFDGDTIYVASTNSDNENKIDLDINKAGVLCILAMEKAIENAAKFSSITDEEYFKNIKC